MLDSLITSKTRIKLLLKFFSNKNSKAYLRGLAEEFNESTNAVRVELNNLTRAGFLESEEKGRIIEYKANEKHPLFPELNQLVLKHIGLDKLVDNVIRRLGNVHIAFITGDYAKGRDSGIIDLVIVGEIDKKALNKLSEKAENKINRKVRTLVLSFEKYEQLKDTLKPDEALWLWYSDTVG